VRLWFTPSDAVGTGFILWDFLFDQPSALGPAVTSDHGAVELDAYLDWKLNKHFSMSVVAATADPGKGVEEAYGRTKRFLYALVFLGYRY